MTSASSHIHGSLDPADHDHGPDRAYLLRDENINLAPGTGKSISTTLLGAGVIAIAVAAFGSTVIGAQGKAHALAALHVGVMSCLAMVLGSLFYLLLFTLVRAGWHATIKRQFENVAMLVPFLGLGVIAVLIADLLLGHPLFTWMGGKYQADAILEEKSAWLNAPFFYLRVLFYIFLWTYLARRLSRLSQEQDRTADRWLSARAGRTSAWGMLAFALSVAFAAFDLLMSTDFKFFSTMWGVYFFAGSAYSGMALAILINASLRRAGKLEGLVTPEHYHDMGKFLLAFTVFWAYIAFSQYFLIWYSNMPEETSFMLARKSNGWQYLFFFLAFGHFLVPFVILLFRSIKKNTLTVCVMACWAIAAHVADIFWIVRPMVYADGQFTDKVGMGGLWVDALAIAGVLAVFAALVIHKVTSGRLVAINDPYMYEALEHKNYV